MKVTINTTLEDANIFARDEEDFEKALTGDHCPIKDLNTQYLDDEEQEPITVRRIDLLSEGETYDLPAKQAQNLIDLGHAEKA